MEFEEKEIEASLELYPLVNGECRPHFRDALGDRLAGLV